MATPYQRLRDKMSPESRREADIKTAVMLEELRLVEIRKALDLTQTEIGEKMGVSQAMISKVEAAEGNILIDTMRKYVEALGATLVIKARFADGEVEISPASLNRDPSIVRLRSLAGSDLDAEKTLK